MTDRLAMTVVFTLSFASYMASEMSIVLQIAPLALFALIVFAKLLTSPSALDALGSLLDADSLLYIAFFSVWLIATSFESTSDNSFLAAILIAICLIAGRVYMSLVSPHEILEAFFWSGLLSIGLLSSIGFSAFVESTRNFARFAPFSFHPNLLGLLAAGYFCAMVWKFITSGWVMKIISGLAGVICLVIVFFASSRGSLMGIALGSLLLISLAVIRALKEGRLKVQRAGILAAILVVASVLYYVRSSVWLQDSFDFTDRILEITDNSRGLDSGMSGRVDKWKRTLNLLSDGSWMTGKGIRSSDEMQDNLIDNGYLVLLYELGLIPLVLVTWRFATTLRDFLKGYWRAGGLREQSFYLGCSLLLIVFLANNFVARYLLAVGNSYSLLALLFFAGPKVSDQRSLASVA